MVDQDSHRGLLFGFIGLQKGLNAFWLARRENGTTTMRQPVTHPGCGAGCHSTEVFNSCRISER